jgi:hypothetical protein
MQRVQHSPKMLSTMVHGKAFHIITQQLPIGMAPTKSYKIPQGI